MGREIEPFIPRWGYYVIGGVLSALLLIVLTLTGTLSVIGTALDYIPALGSILLIIGIYFLPTIIAISRNARHSTAITTTNVLLGLTGIGWIAALIGAIAEAEDAARAGKITDPSGTGSRIPPPVPIGSHKSPRLSSPSGENPT